MKYLVGIEFWTEDGARHFEDLKVYASDPDLRQEVAQAECSAVSWAETERGAVRVGDLSLAPAWPE